MTTSNTVVAMANSLSSLGAVLRELRKARDLIPTLLGQMAEISVNHFSATERGAANPSIDVLNSLTDGIDVSPSCFLACCDGKGPLEQTLVVRSHNRRNSNTLCAEDAYAIGCQDLLLSSSNNDAFDMGLAERGFRSETPDDRMQAHDGEAQGIFLEGELEMWTDDETILPKAGDSYSFDARFPRRARNTSNKPCSMIWAGLPVAFHRGRELAYASPPAQIPACALTHGAPASDDDEGQLARLRVLKPIAVTRETPTQSRLRKCVLHRLVGSAEWSFPPAVGFSRRHERLGIPAGPAALDARHTPPGSSALLSYPVNLM